MKTIMAARSPQECSSFSRRYFNFRKKGEDGENNDEEILTYESSSHSFSEVSFEKNYSTIAEELKSCVPIGSAVLAPKKRTLLPVYKWRSLFSRSSRSGSLSSTLGRRVVGTLFGYRRGHVRIAFQEDAKSNPAFLIELSTPTSVLVREMASGLVRVALECDKEVDRKGAKLLEEPLWRAYCNGKKCGYATRRDCGAEELKVLKAVEPITMGAGVLPREGNEVGGEGELMYMRAKFERVVGSKYSESFYMMNPDGNGGPELSVYLLRA